MSKFSFASNNFLNKWKMNYCPTFKIINWFPFWLWQDIINGFMRSSHFHTIMVFCFSIFFVIWKGISKFYRINLNLKGSNKWFGSDVSSISMSSTFHYFSSSGFLVFVNRIPKSFCSDPAERFLPLLTLIAFWVVAA